MPRLQNITGVGVTTSVAMESADLGILRWDEKRKAIAAMFGDNFEFWRMGGEWQSPSIVMYDNDFRVLGVPTKNGIEMGRRKQLFDYPHNNPEFSTILPCDFIKIGDWWYAALMVTAGLGREKRTVFWQSKDLVDWVKTDPYVNLVHVDKDFKPVGHRGNTMLTFDQIGDYVYTFGTNGLARDRSIWLWRTNSREFPHGWFEPWGRDQSGWGWGKPNEDYPIIVGRFGELCFRYIQGNSVLSFFDAERYCQTALTTVHPCDDWGQANRVDYAWGQQFPQLYGGYIAPHSKLNERDGMKFLVSQWNTSDNDPYWVVQFVDTLQAKGDLIEKPTPPTEPEPEPEEPPVTTPPETAQELYNLLLKELAASGSTLITTSDGRNLTLREAVGEVYEQQCLPMDLKGRPLDPRTPDNQFGHIRSARWEGAFTQALVVKIADKFGIDANEAYRQVKESLG